ncbi:FAD-binding protein [Tritonibacter horizontis]|uniref:Putative FAD-linked oxidoreductase n=1 Tax=Tritonibacter horizontis TaxID=1768241 RepID=A0A132BT08_9RHOB|nr:FAD-binding protein [Tritonibacter horizontis]KUP91528.1 putative FAD-linked oxidoreductase [Tritonibacter horizontis]
MTHPQSEAELADFIAGAKGPLQIQGGNTRGVVLDGDVVSTRGLSGVTLYEPGALTLVVQAGTPVAEVEALLASENQQLAFEPMDHRLLMHTQGEPTMGGVFAANISGPRRIQAGAARDFLLGVRFVDGQGQVLRNGGRVMKNVTGYDLVKLMAGAHGTLGVLSEVSLKVLPTPETTATVTVRDLDLAKGIAALSAALGSPFDVTGASYDPQVRTAYVRLQGFEASVRYRAEALTKILGQLGSVEVLTDCADLWRGIRDVASLAGQPGDVWRISVKPTDAVALIPALGATQVLCDWGGGLIWALMPAGRDLRASMTVPGHATLVRAAEGTVLPRHHPEPAPLARLAAGLRAQFDPRGILNPGLMG